MSKIGNVRGKGVALELSVEKPTGFWTTTGQQGINGTNKKFIFQKLTQSKQDEKQHSTAKKKVNMIVTILYSKNKLCRTTPKLRWNKESSRRTSVWLNDLYQGQSDFSSIMYWTQPILMIDYNSKGREIDCVVRTRSTNVRAAFDHIIIFHQLEHKTGRIALILFFIPASLGPQPQHKILQGNICTVWVWRTKTL